jgi:hypothetical protein
MQIGRHFWSNGELSFKDAFLIRDKGQDMQILLELTIPLIYANNL